MFHVYAKLRLGSEVWSALVDSFENIGDAADCMETQRMCWSDEGLRFSICDHHLICAHGEKTYDELQEKVAK